MMKKNTETSVVNWMDSVEEAVDVMQNKMGGLREELASLREYLQQTLKIQQEIIRSGAPTGNGWISDKRAQSLNIADSS